MAQDPGIFAIVKKDEHRLLGTGGLHNIDPVNRTAEIGIVIGDKDCQGKGYGSDALRLILKIGFDKKNLLNIMLNVYEFNERAVGCYRKVGFREIGRRRNSKSINNKVYDIIFMDITREDYYRESK